MSRIIEIVIGSTLLYSGSLHASAPYYFAGSVGAYNLLPVKMLLVVPFVLPYFMLVVGCCLVLGICEMGARTISILLLSLFFVVQLYAWLSGTIISCGCFGHSTEPISLATVAIPATLAIAMAVVIGYKKDEQNAKRDDGFAVA
jgi:hypothetical protein